MGEFCTPIRGNRRLIKDNPVVKIPPSPFLKRLGYGTGVGVYELERSPTAGKANSPWAIKKLLRSRIINSEYSDRLTEEAKILRTLNHPNVIGFRAFIKTTDDRHCLAMEECSSCLGDMIEQRYEVGLPAFPATNIMKVALDISDALYYLHAQAFILHGDIKSFNILINGDFNICKLCDFGVSLPLTEDGKLDINKISDDTEYVGSQLWSAPEIFKLPQIVTTKADIYAYGLVLWEMLSLIPPNLERVDRGVASKNTRDSSESTNSGSISENSGEHLEHIDNETEFNKRPNLPNVVFDNSYVYVLELFHCCTEANLDDRPSAQDLTISIPEMIKHLGYNSS